MEFVEIGTATVRLEYRRGIYSGLNGEKFDCIKVDRDCGFGCTCGADLLGRTEPPNLQLAIDDVLCFNDKKKQGISGRGCSGRVIQDGPEKWIYEVDAKLKEAKSSTGGANHGR